MCPVGDNIRVNVFPVGDNIRVNVFPVGDNVLVINPGYESTRSSLTQSRCLMDKTWVYVCLVLSSWLHLETSI